MGAEINYEVDGEAFTGYVADGSGGKPAPAVIVFHEASGLGAHARQKADLLAEAGFVAFAADLFGGVARNLSEATGYITRLTSEAGLLRRRCTAALDLLAALPNVDASRMAAIGFCFGGQAALELARSGAPLKAVVGFHSGLGKPDPESAAQIKGSVLLCIGDADPLVPRKARDDFMDDMHAAGVDCQLLTFAGAGHSFTNVDAKAFGVAGCEYDVRAERRSWAAMLALFGETMDRGPLQADS